MSQWMFRDELQLMEINVPRAALQLARSLAYPELNVAEYMSRLHELSEEGADVIDHTLSITAQVEKLSEFLFSTLGFRGNRANYQDPLNSFFNEVIDRRTGIPITLSILYIDIATRLGLPAYGIGLPGHFIVGIRDKEDDIWVDPFHDGRILHLSDCVDLIRLSTGYEGPLEAIWFQPASAKSILARMLGNLRASYVGSGAWSRAVTVIQLLRQVQPNETEHLRDLGFVYYHQGNLPQAAHYLNSYLQQDPNAGDAQVIREGIKNILDEWVPMN